MNSKLIQKKPFNNRSFEIQEKGLIVKIQKLNEEVEEFIPFEQIGNDIVVKKTYSFNPYVSFIVGIIGFFAIIYADIIYAQKARYMLGVFICFIAGISTYFSDFKSFIYLQSDARTLEFYGKLPSNNEIMNFVQEVIKSRNDYLKNQTLKQIEKLSRDEQVISLFYLKNSNIITEFEYQELKKNY